MVTGAARRVGAAIAVELASAGYDLVLHWRDTSADETAARCRTMGADVTLVRADLGTVDGVQTVIDAVCGRFDALELLVHNASTFSWASFDDTTAEHLDAMMAIHARAPLLLSRGLLDRLRKGHILGAPEGQHGVVVHLCDVGADRPVRGYTAYSMSKAALVMLVKSMAVELAPAVRTVGISPGQVAWPDDYDADRRDRLLRRIPMGRVGDPEDVARLVRFVAAEGHYLNGAIVPVDGGLSTRY